MSFFIKKPGYHVHKFEEFKSILVRSL